LTHTHFGGFMIDDVDALQSAAHNLDVAHITANELGRPMEMRGPIGVRAVHLLDQTIEHAHLMPTRDECIDDMRSDKSGSAGNQNM
jgi:hypothetical protein